MQKHIQKYLTSTAAAPTIDVRPNPAAVALAAAIKAERKEERRRWKVGYHTLMSADKARRLGWKVPADAVAVEIASEPTPHLHNIIVL